jgi:hypothetical protein
LEGQYEETEGASEDFEEVYYKEPDLSGGVEGMDYTIAYGSSEGTDDEDIPTVDTTIVPTDTLPHIPQFQGPLTRARAHQLNYQVLLFLGTIPNIHENMMLPKSDVFMLLRNDGPSTDERDKHWSMIVHGDDGSNRVRIQDDAASEDFKTLKPP